MEQEFKLRNLKFASQFKVPVNYKGKIIDCHFFCDFLVEDSIVVELKAVSELNDSHRAQIINYINLLKKPKGILVNFNVKNLYHHGQETFVNKYYNMLT